MLDVILRGGLVIDNSGRQAYRADVGIQGSMIETIGDLAGVQAVADLDARDYIVAPGFIDIHSHSDFTLLVDPRARSAIAQGVTTEVVGNCGHGCAPINDPAVVTGNIYGYTPDVDLAWRSVGEYLDRVDAAHIAVNVATLVPNGCLRLASIDLDERPSSPVERETMARHLEEGLEEGALGFSTGLEYPTERASTEGELIELCRITARHGGIYATHTRNRDSDPLPAIDEAIRTARAAGCPLQLSHIIPRRAGPNTPWIEALAMVDAARSESIDVTFDAHTRLHATTNLSTVLPPALLLESLDNLAARLRDPRVRERVRQHSSIVASFGLGGWDHVTLFSSKRSLEAVGRSFADLAPPGGDALDAILDVLAAEAEDPHYPMCCCHSYEEAWLHGTMRRPHCMLGSDATTLCPDGPLAGSSFLGAYTWVGWFIRVLIREGADLTWEEGVRKLTSMPADRVGLTRRGRLEPGYFADVIALDPARFGERGTLLEPNLLAQGMEHVVVNGVVTMQGGAPTGLHGGRALRRA